MKHTMRVDLPPPETLLPAGTWCALLAQRIAQTSAIEWQVRVRGSIAATGDPRPRWCNGIPIPRPVAWPGLGEDDYCLSSQDIARWLASMGFLVTHADAVPEPPPAAVVPADATEAESVSTAQADVAPATSQSALVGGSSDAPPAPAVAATDEEHRGASASPPAVSTSDIAAAFDGIKWSRADWAANLQKGDATSGWLVAARVQRGQPGPDRPSTWDPVLLGAQLVQKGVMNAAGRPLTKTEISALLRDRFATVPCFRPWHRAWLSHEEVLRSFGDIK